MAEVSRRDFVIPLVLEDSAEIQLQLKEAEVVDLRIEVLTADFGIAKSGTVVAAVFQDARQLKRRARERKPTLETVTELQHPFKERCGLRERVAGLVRTSEIEEVPGKKVRVAGAFGQRQALDRPLDRGGKIARWPDSQENAVGASGKRDRRRIAEVVRNLQEALVSLARVRNAVLIDQPDRVVAKLLNHQRIDGIDVGADGFPGIGRSRSQ